MFLINTIANCYVGWYLAELSADRLDNAAVFLPSSELLLHSVQPPTTHHCLPPRSQHFSQSHTFYNVSNNSTIDSWFVGKSNLGNSVKTIINKCDQTKDIQ